MIEFSISLISSQTNFLGFKSSRTPKSSAAETQFILGGLPIVFLLIQYTVIKETYDSLRIIGGLQPSKPPGTDRPEKEQPFYFQS